MEIQMEMRVRDPLSKDDVFSVAKATNQIFGKQVIGGKGKKVASVTKDGDFTIYRFDFECESKEDMCDILASELYTRLPFDFELEIDCEIDEDYLVPCDDDDGEGTILIEDEPSVKHASWVSRMTSDGWRFGMEHDESNKTCPYLRPYHTLSSRQQNEVKKLYKR